MSCFVGMKNYPINQTTLLLWISELVSIYPPPPPKKREPSDRNNSIDLDFELFYENIATRDAPARNPGSATEMHAIQMPLLSVTSFLEYSD